MENRDSMIAVKEEGKPRRRLFQIARRNKLNMSLLFVVEYLKIGIQLGRGRRYQLMRNNPVTASIIRRKSKEGEKSLGDCRLLEFKLVSKKPRRLSSKLGVLVSEETIFILVPAKAPIDNLEIDGLMKEFKGIFALWLNEIRIRIG